MSQPIQMPKIESLQLNDEKAPLLEAPQAAPQTEPPPPFLSGVPMVSPAVFAASGSAAPAEPAHMQPQQSVPMQNIATSLSNVAAYSSSKCTGNLYCYYDCILLRFSALSKYQIGRHEILYTGIQKIMQCSRGIGRKLMLVYVKVSALPSTDVRHRYWQRGAVYQFGLGLVRGFVQL